MSEKESRRSGRRKIFTLANGLRPIWRFVAFAAAVFVLFYLLEGPVLEYLAGKLGIDLSLLSPHALLLSQLLDFIFVLLLVGTAAALEHRRIDTYGLPLASAFGGKFWEGIAMGFLTVVFVGLGMIATGGMRVRGVALHGSDAIVSPILWLITMLLVGVDEEYLFRGYGLQTLARGIGFWPASMVTTGLFAGAHLSKPHENAIDIGMIFALGILLCFTLVRTGNLWLAIGWHTSFDFGQFFIIGTKNGGQVPVGRLFDVTFPGPAWSNGGELGTEASLFMIPAIVMSFIHIARRYPRTRVT